MVQDCEQGKDDLSSIKLIDIIDFELLQRFQDNFAEAVGLASITIDPDGNPITKPSNYTKFCMQYTHSTACGDKRCAESHRRGGEEAARIGKPVVFECHAGLIDFAAPIILEGRIIGTILGGQVLTESPNEKKYCKIANEIGVNEDEYIEAVKEISVLSQKRIRSAANVLYDIATNLSKSAYLFIETVSSLTKLIGSRDHSTGTHSKRVRDIAGLIGRRLRLPRDVLNDIAVSALLHDIGKIGIPENILNKMGRLTLEEFAVIQLHPEIGYNAIKTIEPLRKIALYIRHHHEAFDGSGYPSGLRGQEIPMVSRILSVADVFEALTADRVYRKAMKFEEAIALLRNGRGMKFDSVVLDAFMQCVDGGEVVGSEQSYLSQRKTCCK